MKKKNIVILGSSGSIGESALDVVRQFRDRLNVVGLCVGRNTRALEQQIREFRPQVVAVADSDEAYALSKRLNKKGPDVLAGREGTCELARLKSADLVLVAVVGAEAVFPLLAAIRAKKTIALANKEAVVIAGSLIRSEAAKHRVRIVPIDSEQNAIFQCLEGRDIRDVACAYLTASGGPLIDYRPADLARVSLKKVLAHPRWKMGPKITVDSATLMNKGLEVIEARELFDIVLDKIKVVIHREALVHSMVEFCDGSILAQLAQTNMRLPIQLALSYPDRWTNDRMRLDPLKMGTLSFEPPDTKRFPCLELAYQAARQGGTMPAVLNAANEVAVDAFLRGALSFVRIPSVIEKTMRTCGTAKKISRLEDVFEADWQARDRARRWAGVISRKG